MLWRITHDVQRGRSLISASAALDQARIASIAWLIHHLAQRLSDRRPVNARAIARLRLLLTDGGGPFYRFGSGDLGSGLRLVLAEL
jgi:hypothetical protein